MHVRTVVSSSTKPSDVELAQLLLLGQFNIMTEVAVVPLVRKKSIIKICLLNDNKTDQTG